MPPIRVWPRSSAATTTGGSRTRSPTPTWPQLFAGLRERGLRIGVLSNTMWPREHHERIFARDEVLTLIDGAAYSCELPVTKPHPDAFRAALAAVGVDDPARAVFVGDRPFDDISGAKAVGMRAVLVPHSAIPAWQVGTLVAGEPDAVVDRLSTCWTSSTAGSPSSPGATPRPSGAGRRRGRLQRPSGAPGESELQVLRPEQAWVSHCRGGAHPVVRQRHEVIAAGHRPWRRRRCSGIPSGSAAASQPPRSTTKPRLRCLYGRRRPWPRAAAMFFAARTPWRWAC